jgi:hypothetical protein
MKKKEVVASAASEAPVVLEPEAIVEQLRALRPNIPDFGPLTVERSRVLRAVAVASPLFLQAAINTIGASAAIQGAVGNPEDLRRDIDLASRWSAVEDELRTLLDGVAAANLTRRHRVALAGLRTYHIGRQLVRNEENSHLLPHVTEMRLQNRFGRRRARKPDPAPPAAPSPQQP